MDLFELLFIAAFILFPVLEGILRQRKKGQGPPKGRQPPREDEEAGREEPRSAADMLPDDLWELMTGERRAPAGGEGSPWSSTPAGASTGTAEPEASVEREPSWQTESWKMDDEAEAFEPESLEYQGPEAYSLETPAPEPESLERPLPTPTARHRAFHEEIDRPPRQRRTVSSPLMRALRSRDGLRRAVVLKEILGPPKGLE